MESDFSQVVGPGLPDFEVIVAALRCQVDPEKLADADRRKIEDITPETDRFAVLQRLLSAGGDPEKFGWTDIFLAVAFGSLDDLEEALTGKSDIEAVDGQERTAFLFSIQVGEIAKTKLLIDAGADILALGDCGRTPLGYAIEQDDVSMLEWLLEQGFDPEQENALGETVVFDAAELGAVRCLRKLIDFGVDIGRSRHSGTTPIQGANDRQVIEILLDAGVNPNCLDPEQLATLLGYKVDEPPECSMEDYRKYRSRAFGRFNPERVHNPFWTAMVRCGGSASLAEMKYSAEARALRKSKASTPAEKAKTQWNDPRVKPKTEMNFDLGYPIWCYRRFGKSINRLPDGRFVEIAGEHEDYYDPNFCIYNDVIVHDGQGRCEIYAYPADVFPPTDFHSATRVGDFILIIGNLGYVPDRKPGFTPVYRLSIASFKIEPVETKGDMPGWIHGHAARFDGRTKIRISDGRCAVWDNGKLDFVDNRNVFELDLETLTWTRTA
ncbi:hypothetical protein ABID16_002307 [Rhizobium aquaticum]|uniref:Ankyrin repeat protein n=1 Tax=Rhizobium aquaticum TaxID=1549636 RepID=A0ABV2IZR4_9HYPH